MTVVSRLRFIQTATAGVAAGASRIGAVARRVRAEGFLLQRSGVGAWQLMLCPRCNSGADIKSGKTPLSSFLGFVGAAS